MNNKYYGMIACILFILIFVIDMNSNILKVSNSKPIQINKYLFVLLSLGILIIIEYIEDFITYNYLDDMGDSSSPNCEENSFYDAILAGVSEEIILRLIIFNLILIQYFKISFNKSIIISGILFGLIHINQYLSFGVNIYNTSAVIIQAIFGGIIFAYVYMNTNLSTVILLHFLIDYIDFMFLRCNKSFYKKILFIKD